MTRLHASLLVTALLAACSSDSATGANPSPTKVQASGGQTITAEDRSGPASVDGVELGQLLASEHINLNALVNKTPAEVEAVLGPPEQVGSDRVSCVRFVPKRVFFACEQEIRQYAHPPFGQIRVEFEDGRAASVALSGLPGQGPFDHMAALASVGVVVPGTPHHDSPPIGVGGQDGDNVDRWEWSNSQARLRVDELEHRVRVSVINGEWSRAKVEVINNNPLSVEQKSRIKPPRGEAEVTASSPAQ